MPQLEMAKKVFKQNQAIVSIKEGNQIPIGCYEVETDVKTTIDDQIALINLFPEIKQAVKVEAMAIQLDAKERLVMLQTKVNSLAGRRDPESQDQLKQLLTELKSLRSEQISLIEESFKMVQGIS